MCGIAGVFSLKPLPARQWVETCMQFSHSLSHRGPNDEGFVLFDADGNIHAFGGDDSLPENQLPHIQTAEGDFVGAFIHRRLSIIKPGVAGHQPFSSPDARNCMVYNGETFNYPMLDERYGFSNHGGTDTETVFNLLCHSGMDAVTQLDGFYALAFWNKEQKTLHLRRDMTGVKPLYYTQTEDAFVFCSETRPLRRWLGEVNINTESVFHHLVEGVFLPQTGFYQEIASVHEGLDCNLRTLECTPVYYPDIDGIPKDSLGDSLKNGIKQRLMSDVPLGFAVSGGIDSAAIIGYARQALGPDADLALFSVVSPNTQADEYAWQQQVAEYNGAIWHKLDTGDIGHQALAEVASATDLPPLAWNNLAHYELCELAKSKGVTVFFNGQGADELFGGYPDYLYRDFFSLQGVFLQKRNHLPVAYREALKQRMLLQMKAIFPGLVSIRLKRNAKGLVNRDLWKTEPYLPKLAHLSADHKMEHDFFSQKLRQMLIWDDMNGMAHGLESRNPFADNMELARWLNVRFSEKITHGYTKGVLRDALHGIVPENVRLRVDKKGFTVPDNALTWKNRNHWSGLLMSEVLDDWSPRPARERLLKTLSEQNTSDLRWYFRLSAMAAFLQQSKP